MSVRDIVQDKQGFLWFATDDGLNKYDGIRMEVYKDDPSDRSGTSLSDREIKSLYLHQDGSLWIGTSDGGVNRYNRYFDNFKQYKHDTSKENSLGSNTIHKMVNGLDGEHIWVATPKGLDYFNTSNGSVEHVLQGLDVRDMGYGEKGVLWIATYNKGLIRLDVRNGVDNASHKEFLPIDSTGSLIHKYANRMRAILIDSKGRIWLGHHGGHLSLFNKLNQRFQFYYKGGSAGLPSNRVTSLLEDHDGRIWVGTASGLALFNEEREEFRVFQEDENDPFSLSNSHIQSIYEDEANSIWLGTSQGGVNVYHRTLGKFNHVKKEKHNPLSLRENTVFAFEEDKYGYIWVGTVGEGLSRYDLENEHVDHFGRDDNKTHSNILTIESTKDGKVWFGTWGGGLNHFDVESGEFGDPIKKGGPEGLSSNTVLDIEEDASGNLWVATFAGLNYYNVLQDTIYVYTRDDTLISPNGKKSHLLFDQIYSLYIDENDRIWIGTNGGGLSILDPRDMVFHNIEESGPEGLSNNTVLCINEGPNGNIWLGTKKGLNRVDPNVFEIKAFYESDGLSSDYINGVLFDQDGYLWLSTNNGITKFNPEVRQDGEYFVRQYYAIDGLQGDEFNQNAALRTSKGEMFFGGLNGFNHFYPENIVDNPHKPPIVLRSFKVFGKEYKMDSSIAFVDYIELSWRQNFFSFEFAALDFVLPEKNLYRYKMEGLDEDWSVPTHRPYASYTSLPGGEYTFRVQASNNDGVWNDTGIAIKIYIEPPFWKTTWFYILCVVVGILGVVVFIRVRTQKIKREKLVLEQKVAERTKELAEKSEELEEKNKDIMDSIQYAKKIQTAILPEKERIISSLPEMFVLYLPKDIVSGDFYWYGEKDDKLIITAVDCTGHGVPGAFMSMIGSNLLNQIVMERGITDPGTILENLNKGVQHALKQGTDSQETNDGMDIALCTIDMTKGEVSFAGAYNPLYLIRDGELNKVNANKYPIGGAHVELDRTFDTHTYSIKPGDGFYIFSDGFPDQFGGPKGKKFMAKKFQRLLMANFEKPMSDQRDILEQTLEEWRGDMEQIDDVLVIGVKFKA